MYYFYIIHNSYLSGILMLEEKTIIKEGGRILIPASFRKQLNLQIGDELIVKIINNEIVAYPLKKAIRDAQDIVKQYIQGTSLTEELKTLRQEEVSHEETCH